MMPLFHPLRPFVSASWREQRLIGLMPGGGESMRPAEPSRDARREAQPKTPEETQQQQQPEAKQDKGMAMRSLFGEDPQALKDYTAVGYRQGVEQSAALTSAHINQMAENEQNMLNVIKKNPNWSPTVLNTYIERRNEELHPRGLHLSVNNGRVSFSPHKVEPNDPRNQEIARVKNELGAVNHRIWSIQQRFSGAGVQYAHFNAAQRNPWNRAPEITRLAQRGSAEDAVAYEAEWRNLLGQKRALETRLDDLQMDKRLNPGGERPGTPEQRDTGRTFERPDRSDRRYDLADQNNGDQGTQERGRDRGIMRNVREDSHPLSTETPDRVRAIMKKVESLNKAKTEEDQQIAEGALRMLGVDVDASNLQSGKPEDITIAGKEDRGGNMIVGLFQWVGGWLKKLGGKKTSLENKDVKKQKEAKDMTPDERKAELKTTDEKLKDNAKKTTEIGDQIKKLEGDRDKDGVSAEDKGKINEKIDGLKKDLATLKTEKDALEARKKEIETADLAMKEMPKTPENASENLKTFMSRIEQYRQAIKELVPLRDKYLGIVKVDHTISGAAQDVLADHLKKNPQYYEDRGLSRAEQNRFMELAKPQNVDNALSLVKLDEVFQKLPDAEKGWVRTNVIPGFLAYVNTLEPITNVTMDANGVFHVENKKDPQKAAEAAPAQKDPAAGEKAAGSAPAAPADAPPAGGKGVDKGAPAAKTPAEAAPPPAKPAAKEAAPTPAKTETAPPAAPAAKEATPPVVKEPIKAPATPQPEAKQAPVPTPGTVPEKPGTLR